MSRSRRKYFGIATISAITALLFFILHAGVGVSKDTLSAEVRMSVDPTVLPSTQTDPAETPATESKAEPEIPPQQSITPETPPVAQEEAITEVVELPVETPAPQPEEQIESAQKPTVQDMPVEKNTQAEPVKQTGPGVITSIALNSTDSGFTLTMKADQPVGDTSYMNLANPQRLVLDLRQHWKLKAGNVIRPDSGMVKHVVIGQHPDRLRFVVHFNTPQHGTFTPEFIHDGNTLTISVTKP